MKKVGIYKIENLCNKKVYIGSSQDILQRIRLHRSQLKKNIHGSSHLQNAWNKYGEENFKFSIIELCKKDTLIEREKFYIDKFKATNRDKGYNKASIIENTSGYKWSIESRKKLSISKTGTKMHPNTRKAIIEANKNRIYKKGFKRNREEVEKSAKSREIKILQYSIDGTFIKEWDSAKDASLSIGIHSRNIRFCCIGNRYIAGGYQWMNRPANGIYPNKILPYKRCSKLKSIYDFMRLCSEMSIVKQGELLETPNIELDENN